MSYYAVDFGTSNSLLSYVSDSGKITPVPLDQKNGLVLRSLLFTPERNKWFFGSEAISEYVSQEENGRFFRSIKKFLPEPSYSGTVIHNKNFGISDLVAVFLREMRLRADKFIGEEVTQIVLGRPALYSLDPVCDKLAEDRMKKAAEIAGFKEVIFCPEPIAAGLDYHDEEKKERIVLITDFGGGTSDFTLMKFHGGEYSKDDILGLSGLFVAGDALDGVMMREFISPQFGSKFEYQFPGSSNILKFPRNLLDKICSPAHITHLRERDTWEYLQHINKFALSPSDETHMKNLFTLVECQLGFPLFNEIERVKVALGKEDSIDFNYQFLDLDIKETIFKKFYNASLGPTIIQLKDSLMDVFNQSGLKPSDVDQVCLTGGTSQFPLIKSELKALFGEEKLLEHNIYQSVVNGLAKFATKL